MLSGEATFDPPATPLDEQGRGEEQARGVEEARAEQPHPGALDGAAQPLEVPCDRRLIEPKILADGLDGFGCRPLPENRLREISGQHVHGCENDNGNDEER